MDWKLLGLVRVVHAEGPDVTRSSAGRAVSEGVWVPTALLPRYGVRWTATSEYDLTARLAIDGDEVSLHLRVDRNGHLEWVRLDRWGDPNQTGVWGLHPFGFQVTGTRCVGPFTIPAVGTAGWFHGTHRWADGQFIRFDITGLHPILGPSRPETHP